MPSRRLENAAYLTGGLIGGAFVVFLCAVYFLGIQDLWEFSLYDFMKFVVTLFVAVFIAYYLKNKHSDIQIKKKTFIEIVDQVRKRYEDNIEDIVSIMIMNNKTVRDRNRITLLFRTISNKINVLERSRHEYNSDVFLKIEELKECHKEIKKLITGDHAFAIAGAFSIKVIDKSISRIHYALSIIDDIKLKIFL